MQSEVSELKRRWLNAVGDEMPGEIVSSGLIRMRRAVELVEGGAHVFVPKPIRREEPKTVSSLMDWDKHAEF